MKEKMSDVFENRRKLCLDANRFNKQKKIQTARAVSQSKKLADNANTHEENRLRELSSSSKCARD
jgi:hypothetical protein